MRWVRKPERLPAPMPIVTFTAPRPAHVFGSLTKGPTFVADIGSPEEAIVSALQLNVITARDVAPLIGPRPADSNKGNLRARAGDRRIARESRIGRDGRDGSAARRGGAFDRGDAEVRAWHRGGISSRVND